METRGVGLEHQAQRQGGLVNRLGGNNTATLHHEVLDLVIAGLLQGPRWSALTLQIINDQKLSSP